MNWSLSKLEKVIFWRKNFFLAIVQLPLSKKNELKDEEMWNIYFVKPVLKRMERLIFK